MNIITTDTEHPSTSLDTHPDTNQAPPCRADASRRLVPPTCPAKAPARRRKHPREGGSFSAKAEAPGEGGRRAFRARVRNGKIARLHKLRRDLVNRMLYNHVPYVHIVEALEECDIQVTERNVSNWKSRGGYQEWCLEQERQLNLSRLQDNVTDYLRKQDATQLPEVGLQVASTHLTHLLLQPDSAQQLAADPRKYAQVVDMLCHISTQIQSLQKDRDVDISKISRACSPEQFKYGVEKQVDTVRRIYSSRIRNGSIDPEIPHRNELPQRDELPFQELRPLTASTFDIWAQRELARTKSAGPSAPPPQPAKNEKSPSRPPSGEKEALTSTD